MTLQAITYAGRTAATAGPRRFYLAEHLDQRAPDDPERIFVTWMCCCARDILTGDLPGPYSDSAARTYAAAALIPRELLERPAPAGDARLAYGLGVPLDELHHARGDYANATPEIADAD
jgi:hypothetical protein